MTETDIEFPVLNPHLQTAFYHRYREIEQRYFHEALRQVIARSELAEIDRELGAIADAASLRRAASFGLRGEVFFATPLLLSTDPHLLGYYRLLLGFSQKEFYSKGPFGRFKALEERGILSAKLTGAVKPLCRSLASSASLLISGIDDLSLGTVRDLQLLTLGPQLRGGRNTQLGQDATREVFDLIRGILEPFAVDIGERSIRVENASGRTVLVEFFSDPDIRIVELLPSTVRPIVSVEIKGGGDVSNIHNRLGEAEKSHQKARAAGFFEFWTILRADVDPVAAHRESPTTSHFFHLDAIKAGGTPEHAAFRELLGALVGVRM